MPVCVQRILIMPLTIGEKYAFIFLILPQLKVLTSCEVPNPVLLSFEVGAELVNALLFERHLH